MSAWSISSVKYVQYMQHTLGLYSRPMYILLISVNAVVLRYPVY